MNRLSLRFANLQAKHKTALVPYITAGDPEPWITVPLLHALVNAGADIIELGIPFSDPMCDGPTIQKACERALKNHISIGKVLDMVKQFREKDQDTPIVLMGYVNPIEAVGYEHFTNMAAEAGVDGVLTVDMPPEESESFRGLLAEKNIDMIYLVAPTTSEQRMKLIADSAQGFIYYVAIKGVTGTATLDMADVEPKINALRQQTSLPLGVGFGIRNGESAAAAAKVADAVVVGSTLVQCIEDHSNDLDNLITAVAERLIEMRIAINNVNKA